jgi:hypothetical protein
MLSKVTPRSASEIYLHWEHIKKNVLNSVLKREVGTEHTNPQWNRGTTSSSRDDLNSILKREVGTEPTNPQWNRGNLTSSCEETNVTSSREETNLTSSCWENDVTSRDSEPWTTTDRGVEEGGAPRQLSVQAETLIVNFFASGNDASFTSGNGASFTSGNGTSFTSGNGVDSEMARPYHTRNDLDPFVRPQQDEAITIAGTAASAPPEALPLRARDPFQGPFERTQRSDFFAERSREEERFFAERSREEERIFDERSREEERNGRSEPRPTRPPPVMSPEPQQRPFREEDDAEQRIRMWDQHETAEDRLRRLEAELKCALELAAASGSRPSSGIRTHHHRSLCVSESGLV